MRSDQKTVWKWNTALSFVLFVVISLHNVANSECSVSTPDTITVCDGEVASFSWPCDLAYDLAKVMTLTFKGLRRKGQVLATIDSSGRVNVSEAYSGRVTSRGTSGVHLGRVGIEDSGIYWTTATFANGTVIERQFNLNVQVAPLLMEDHLKVTLHNTSPNCQSITCDRVVFPGFPALSFHWQTPERTQSWDSSGGSSMVHGCPLLPGIYTCQVRGSALTCGKRFPQSAVDTASLSASTIVSADTVTAGTAKSAEQEQKELVLMIVIPIVAVMTPLLILGVWLLSHTLSGSSCCDQDTETGLLASAVPSPVERSPSTVTPASPSAPDTAPRLSEEPGAEQGRQESEGEGGAEQGRQESEGEGADKEEEKEEEDGDLDLDIADPTVPLMDQDTIPPFDLDDDGSETRL